MRVLLFSATPRSDRGGVQAMVEALHSGLLSVGATVVRVGPDELADAGHYPLILEAGAADSGRPSLRALPGAAASIVRLAFLLARFRPDIVNVHFVTGATAYFLALRPIFRFKLVLSAHGGDLRRAPASIAPHLRRFLRRADAVTVVSEDLAGTARASAGCGVRRLTVIPNGIDTDFWSPPTEDARDPAGIVAAGRLQDVKGFDLLVRAIDGLPDARLVILGDGPERETLTELAESLGVGDRLQLPGHCDRKDVRCALREAAVFSLPSRSEGMPLALIEALACGVPAVAANVGGVPEVLSSRCGILVEPENVEALRAGLRKILSGVGKVTVADARERALEFSEARTSAAYLSLFRDLSDQNGTHGP